MIRLLKGQIAVEPIFDSDYYNPNSQLIRIPDSSKERCDQGIVKYMGEGCDPSIKVGDHIIFSGYTGTTLGIDKELLIILHNKFVKAVISVDDYIVPGLYFRAKFDLGGVLEDSLIKHNFDEAQRETILRTVAAHIGSTYIPATYETSITFIRDAASEFQLKIKPDDLKQNRDPIDEDNL